MEKQYIDKLAWIYLKDNKILTTKSRGKDTWYIPGGKREDDESDLEALVREIKEELTIDLNPDTAQLYGVFEAQAHGKPEGTMIRMTCYTAEFKGEIQPDSEIEFVDYFDYSGKDKSSPVDKLIYDDLKEKGLIG